MIVFQRYRKPCNDFRLLNYLQNIHNYVSLCAWCINIDYRSKTYRFHGVQKKIDFLVLHHTVTVYNPAKDKECVWSPQEICGT